MSFYYNITSLWSSYCKHHSWKEKAILLFCSLSTKESDDFTNNLYTMKIAYLFICVVQEFYTHMHTTPPPSTPAPLLWWFPLDFCLFSCSDDVPYIHCSQSCVDSMYRSRPLRVMWMYNTLWLQGNKQDWKGSVEQQRI